LSKRTIKGPGIFFALFMGEESPFNAMEPIARWAANLGYLGLQVPASNRRLIDLREAAASKAYCDEITAMLAGHGLVITELASQRIGHLVAVHPTSDGTVDVLAPPERLAPRLGSPSRRSFRRRARATTSTAHIRRRPNFEGRPKRLTIAVDLLPVTKSGPAGRRASQAWAQHATRAGSRRLLEARRFLRLQPGLLTPKHQC
jgi:hypothetical protein